MLLKEVMSVLGMILLRYQVHLMDRVGYFSVLHIWIEGIVDVVRGR